jgi:hypothetical protein
MYIDIIPNRKSPPAILLREGKRIGGKVVKSTVANLTALGLDMARQVQLLLKGGHVVMPGDEGFAGGNENDFEVVRSLPHGAVAAVLGMIRKLGVDKLVWPKNDRTCKLLVSMIAQRILSPASKLAGSRALNPDTADSSLGVELGIDGCREDELYAAMDALLPRQHGIEKALAKRHLQDGVLVMYDLTSAWMTGTQCPLAKHGYSRDGKRGTLQIEFGLLCDKDGRPVAVEVFEGNTSDPSTVASQVAALKKRFGLSRVVLVGDRGMLTEARIQEDVKPAGLDWISCLRAPAIKKLAETKQLQPELFDETNLVSITSPDFPGERLVACRNGALANKRAQTRRELLAAAEKEMQEVTKAVLRTARPLSGVENITRRVTRILGRSKMGKHFTLNIGDKSFSYERNEQSIREEAALDGIYIIRSSVEEETMNAPQLVGAYKNLSKVERAFRSIKTVDLKVRPIHHHLEKRVRAHVFLCMLAYYVEWHMREALDDMLFADPETDTPRPDPVTKAVPSKAAKEKTTTQHAADGLPLHSFQTLLRDLATLTRMDVSFRKAPTFVKFSTPTPIQEKAANLLGVKLDCSQAPE